MRPASHPAGKAPLGPERPLLLILKILTNRPFLGNSLRRRVNPLLPGLPQPRLTPLGLWGAGHTAPVP